MYEGLASFFLPTGVLDYFEVTDLAEVPTLDSGVLSMSREKWSVTQEKRAKILFELYPKLVKSVRDTIKFYEDEILNYIFRQYILE